MFCWKPSKILIVFFGEPTWRSGYEYRGVGLFQLMGSLPEYGMSAHWGLYHLGSGHFVIDIQADEPEVFDIATEVVEAGDWTFDGLTGWRNQFSDLRQRIEGLQAKYPGRLTRHPGEENPDLALQVLMQRDDKSFKGRTSASRKKKP